MTFLSINPLSNVLYSYQILAILVTTRGYSFLYEFLQFDTHIYQLEAKCAKENLHAYESLGHIVIFSWKLYKMKAFLSK